MTLFELITLLEEIEADCEDDPDVRTATQPSWPFENGISDVVMGENGTVYVKEGEQIGYLPGDVRDAFGW